MTEIGSIINSEGPLLTLKCESKGEILLEAYSIEYRGKLSFEPRFKDFISYIESKITLEELISISENCMFFFNRTEDTRRIPLEDIINSLPFKDVCYKEVPESCK